MLEPTYWLLGLEWCVRLGFSFRVIMRRGSVGSSLAWLSIILLVPFVGACVYFFLSETRLGYRRAVWAIHLRQRYESWRAQLYKSEFVERGTDRSDPAQLARLITEVAQIPPLIGNRLQLMESADEIFLAMIDDIENAQHCCHLEYYIWETGGVADRLAEALSAAARRGVDCRILVDAVGSRGFLRSECAQRLKQDGIQIRAALPASLFRALFYRFDLRLHRKIAVFDRRAAYVGSQNMADPSLFQKGAGFGQWIDAMVRIEGPAVDALSMTFCEDWQLDNLHEPAAGETRNESGDRTIVGSAPVQVIPTGPGVRAEAMKQSLLNAIYMADEKLFLTTPYFVPDESLQIALISAARRGVKVTIIIPQKVNSVFVRLASRPLLRELIEAGVCVACYQAGMLHTKSVVIDDDTSLFGSLNLDARSLHLNFEITLAIYESAFTESLSNLQQRYLSNSQRLTSEDLETGSHTIRFVENCTRLLSPLL